MENKSKNRIVQDLSNKGIDKEAILRIFDEVYSDYDSEEVENAEYQQIEKLLEKKHYSSDMDFKEKQKIMAFLLRRGYNMDSIRKCMDF